MRWVHPIALPPVIARGANPVAIQSESSFLDCFVALELLAMTALDGDIRLRLPPIGKAVPGRD